MAERSELQLQVSTLGPPQKHFDDFEFPEPLQRPRSYIRSGVVVERSVDAYVQRAGGKAQIDGDDLVRGQGLAFPGVFNDQLCVLHNLMSLEEVIRRVLSAYPGLSSNAQVEAISSGLINQSFSVSDNGVECVLQRVNQIFRAEIHQNIQAVSEHLHGQGFATPRLLPTRAGDFFVELEAEGRWRLMTRLPGTTYDACGSPERARSAASLVARFHGALSDLTHEFEPLGFPFHDTRAYRSQLASALQRHREHRFAKDVAEIAAVVTAGFRAFLDLHEQPLRAGHGDLKFNNILFVEQQASALIDLDTLSRLPLALELGDAWRSWCNRPGEDSAEADLDLDVFRAAAAGYLDSSPLELAAPELESLVVALDYISLELAARFATDALEECYFGWDEQRFESDAEHNLLRARGQLSLYRQAEQTRSERRGFLLG